MQSRRRVLSILLSLAVFVLLVPLLASERPLMVWFLPSQNYADDHAELQAALLPELRQALSGAGGVTDKAVPIGDAASGQALSALFLKLESMLGWLDEASAKQLAATRRELQLQYEHFRTDERLAKELEPALRRLEEAAAPGNARTRMILAFPAWHALGWGEMALLASLLLLGAGVQCFTGGPGKQPSGRNLRASLLLLLAVSVSGFKLAAGPQAMDYSAIRGKQAVRLYVPSPVPYASESIDLNGRFSAPSRRHWLGTDSLGRDLLSRLIWGARVSLSIALLALGFQLAIGTSLGGLAVLPSRWICALFSRAIDGLISIPPLFLALAIGALLGANLVGLVTAIALAGSLPVAQLFRAELRRVNALDYIAAARNLGLGRLRIFRCHLLPNALAPVFGHVGYGVAASILMESSLSFLGLGVQAPAASWGGILSEARGQLDLWWVMLFPGACIIVTVALVQWAAGGTQSAMAVKPRQA